MTKQEPVDYDCMLDCLKSRKGSNQGFLNGATFQLESAWVVGGVGLPKIHLNPICDWRVAVQV